MDTHVLIWLAGDSKSLSEQAIAMILDKENALYLSFVSIWELQIKSQLGKLTLGKPLPDLISQQCTTNELQLLPIQPKHIYALQDLPNHHRDPFDRLLIAQSRSENIPLLSIDSAFDGYEVQRIW